MYQKHRRQFSRGRNQFRRNQKTFDPSFLIKATTTEVKLEEYQAKNTFGDFQISENLKQNISRLGYTIPTPIQDQAIPYILNGHDLIGIARTGTGKTAAFLLPLINKVLKNYKEKVLVIAPTRELAVQIQDELNKFSVGLNIKSVLCIGGVGLHGQVKLLYKNPNFVIGTPGRLKDIMNQRRLNLSEFRNIVLDEVDLMLDMGFFEDVNTLIFRLPRERQSLFFSATVSPKIQIIMNKLLRNPIKIQIASNAPTTNVEQEIIELRGRSKDEVLYQLLQQKDLDKVLVFGRTKHGVEKLSRSLIQKGHRAASIHGNKSQSQRQRALTDFKENHIRILLATDIASRGLDIRNVSHVINYDLPESQEDYIHRIGRTGRADKKGKAITFV